MKELICKFCGENKKTEMSHIQHQIFCKKNPNRFKTYTENWNKDKKKRHSDLMKKKSNNKNRVWKPETIEKLRVLGKENNLKFWTEEEKLKQSERMRKIVKENPDSYSISNVCGRTKIVNYNGFKLNGKWELEVAKWLDKNNIKWTNIITNPFDYEWNGKIHSYFPDFYLIEKNLYLEVKGYERERDKFKWSVVPNLKVLKNNEIKKIKSNTFSL